MQEPILSCMLIALSEGQIGGGGRVLVSPVPYQKVGRKGSGARDLTRSAADIAWRSAKSTIHILITFLPHPTIYNVQFGIRNDAVVHSSRTGT